MSTQKPRPASHLAALTLIACLAIPMHAFAADEAAPAEGEVPTLLHLLVGYPDPEASDIAEALVVPGTVIPVTSKDHYAPRTLTPDQETVAGILNLSTELRKTLRLDRLDVRYARPLNLAPGVVKELPVDPEDATLRLSVELLASNGGLATYRVRFEQGGEELTDTSLAVRRGQRAVVGSRNGPAAPFLFLVVAHQAKKVPGEIDVDVTPPRAVHRVDPIYTPEAKEERIQGVVVLRAAIDAQGNVGKVAVLKGLPYGLSEAAVDAVSQWLFTPAMDAEGKPVDVLFNLTINFRLD